MIDFFREVERAEQRIRPYLRETPLEYSHRLSEPGKYDCYVKLENLQYTGSFKARGALNTLLSLTPEERIRGVVAASTGNHGAAVAYGLKQLDIHGVVYVPRGASPSKVEAIRRYGAEIRAHGDDGLITETEARRYAMEQDMTYISPYNDPRVVAGQGTISSELLRQLEEPDNVFLALGGGGLLAGVAGYLKVRRKGVRVIACSPINSPVMYTSLKANRIVDMPFKPTLSDGTAGGVEPGAITFELCRRLIDDHCLVSEDEIRKAMILFMESHHQMIEGAAGVAIAAYLKMRERLQGQKSVIIVCGANIDLTVLKNLLSDIP